MRCARCGRRIAGSCPEHGTPEASRSDAINTEAPPDLPYRIVRTIGFGGFGTVYLAEARDAARLVAVKVAHEAQSTETAAELEAEARALRAVGPPYAPELYEVGELVGGRGYLAMEYVDAPTLADELVADRGPRTVSDIGATALRVLSSVVAVHQRGLTHGDLKPENVLLCAAPAPVKLVDFGLAKRLDNIALAALPATAVAVGTAEYMSPEQCGSEPITARSDVYALGVILYEMFVQRPPFIGTAADVHQAHLGRRPPRPSQFGAIPDLLEQVVLRCLSKDATQRYPDAAALRDAVLAALAAAPQRGAGDDPVARPASLPSSVRVPASNHPDRRSMVLVSWEASAGPVDDAVDVRGLGGVLVSATERGRVVAFDHDASEHPARHAVQLAEALLAGRAAPRVVIDIAAVTVQTRRDGSKRYLYRAGRMPTAALPLGIAVTREASELLDGRRFAETTDPALLHLLSPSDAVPEDQTFIAGNEHPMIGRDDVLRSLIANARHAIAEGAPTIATVLGDAGHGKSRLRKELAALLVVELAAARVLTVHVSDDRTRPTHTLVCSLLELPGTAGADELAARLRQRFGDALADDAWPILANMLDPTVVDARVQRLAAAPGALRSAAAHALGTLLRRAAQARPVALVLDDAHLAEPTVLDAIEYATLSDVVRTAPPFGGAAARAQVPAGETTAPPFGGAAARAQVPAGETPLWVCVLARPVFTELRTEWAERAASYSSHELGPVDSHFAIELCQHLLRPAEDVPHSALERLVERAHAVPFLLVELIRGLKREGLVRQHAKTDTWYLATDELDRLPDLPVLEWSGRRELESLPPDLAAHAGLFSALAGEFTAAEIEGVAAEVERTPVGGTFPLDTGIALRRLVDRGVLVSARRRFAFRYPLLREVVYRSLPASTRQTIEVAATRFYERVALPDALRLRRLAHHAARAGLRQQAAGLYLELAGAAQYQHNYLDAEALYSAAGTQLDEADAPVRMRAWIGRGVMRYRLGRYEDAIADLTHASELARQLGDRATEIGILLDEATVLDWMGDYHASNDRVERAHALAETVSDAMLAARLLLGRGRALLRASRNEEGIVLMAEAAEHAESLGDPGYETFVIALGLLGWSLLVTGRFGEAEAPLERCVAVCTARGDRLHQLMALNNRGQLFGYLGDTVRLQANYAELVQLARELGSGVSESVGEYNCAEVLYLMGELELAMPHSERARVLLHRRLGEWYPPMGALLAARLHLFAGDEQMARGLLDEIQRHQARAETEGHREALMSPSDKILCTAIELATHDAPGPAWDALEADAARDSIGQEQIEIVEARALVHLRRGRRVDAEQTLARAIALCASIPNFIHRRIRKELEALAP